MSLVSTRPDPQARYAQAPTSRRARLTPPTTLAVLAFQAAASSNSSRTSDCRPSSPEDQLEERNDVWVQMKRGVGRSEAGGASAVLVESVSRAMRRACGGTRMVSDPAREGARELGGTGVAARRAICWTGVVSTRGRCAARCMRSPMRNWCGVMPTACLNSRPRAEPNAGGGRSLPATQWSADLATGGISALHRSRQKLPGRRGDGDLRSSYGPVDH